MTWEPIKTCPMACMVLLARAGQDSTLTGMKVDNDMFITGSMPYLNPTHWMHIPEAPPVTKSKVEITKEGRRFV